MNSPSQAFFDGVKKITPFLLSAVPFAMIYGASAAEAGLSPGVAWGMSLIVFAGAAQLVVVDLLARDSQAWVIVGTALIVNLRMAMYSAAIAPHFKHLSGRWRAALAYLLTDQAFAVSITGFERQKNHREWFYLGAAVAMWGAWQMSTGAGVFMSETIPAEWSLDFAVPLTFIALLAPAINNRAMLVVAILSGAVAVMAATLPFNLGLLLGASSGVALGGLIELWRKN